MQCTTCTTVESGPTGYLLRNEDQEMLEDSGRGRVEVTEPTLELKEFVKRKQDRQTQPPLPTTTP